MKNVLTCLVLSVCLQTAPCIADNPAFVIVFGGEPGAPLAHAYDYGAPDIQGPVYTMRIPTIDEAVRSVFYDVELAILRDTKLVQGVHAERAYRIGDSCPEAQELIAEKLTALLPREYQGDDARWQYQSVDGKVVGRAVCTRTRHLPMPVLVLDLGLASGG